MLRMACPVCGGPMRPSDHIPGTGWCQVCRAWWVARDYIGDDPNERPCGCTRDYIVFGHYHTA